MNIIILNFEFRDRSDETSEEWNGFPPACRPRVGMGTGMTWPVPRPPPAALFRRDEMTLVESLSLIDEIC